MGVPNRGCLPKRANGTVSIPKCLILLIFDRRCEIVTEGLLDNDPSPNTVLFEQLTRLTQLTDYFQHELNALNEGLQRIWLSARSTESIILRVKMLFRILRCFVFQTRSSSLSGIARS